jgi:protein ImuA
MYIPIMSDVAHILDRKSHRKRAASDVRFLDDLSMDRGRVHEACGIARRRLAMMLAGAMQGPVFWIRPAWMPAQLNPEGMLKLADPARFIFAAPQRPEDLLWTMEEVLRAGLVPLVVADLPDPPGLTAVRRLHLAAKTGAAEGTTVPLGLLLTPGTGGAPGVETRWSLTPGHGTARHEAWKLVRLRARMQPEKSWHLSGTKTGAKIEQAPAH